MKKIVTILGARPQFVKAAVLSREILKHQEIEEIIVHTGQHYDANMSDIFFSEMEIPKPKYNLAINGLNHGAMTGQMLQKIEEVLVIEKPDGVVVFGDTNSTLAGALAAKKLHIKVVHIEAGLRSFNMKMPEEINRILTDRISDLLLCPTDSAIDNLVNEGFENMPIKIVKSGDIMKDAVEYYSQFSQQKSTIISDLKLEKNEFVLATIHRQENTDDLSNLNSIFAGLETIGKEKTVVLPLHPRTEGILKANNLNFNIKIIDPVGYFDMLELLKNCNLVVTDSGGLQKEAFFNKKHCIIAREETEWIELVTNGFAKIVGTNTVKMIEAFTNFQNSTINFEVDLYGNNIGENMYKEILKIV
ncbi:non-hydrolyzing UDP-N-acetylglucosamine 2-epimerase [Lutibacter sp.]|uniref:non-hydrolyzing UDP-N-acetylglucosamine 2-epimerase n=1 Tax=Lutibacter sp. TaxID=1925666 RepID=UPI0035685B8E